MFENFSTTIDYGDKIDIVGNNGDGKSSLLNYLIAFELNNLNYSYIKQLSVDNKLLSGAEIFLKNFSQALGKHPDILLLD